MASKPKKPGAPEAEKYQRKQSKQAGESFPRKEVQVMLEQGDSDETKARKMTASVTSNEMAALRVMRGAERKSGYWDSVDVPALMDQLRGQAEAINNGDLSEAEAMLINQATALQSLFARLAERGMGCNDAPAFEANMRMALRAQSQCRATLETLAAIKNPPIVYVKQANFAAGHQQVNNGTPPSTQARENEKQQSTLLEAHNGERMDTGATGAASGADKAMATVGEINGTTDKWG